MDGAVEKQEEGSTFSVLHPQLSLGAIVVILVLSCRCCCLVRLLDTDKWAQEKNAKGKSHPGRNPISTATRSRSAVHLQKKKKRWSCRSETKLAIEQPCSVLRSVCSVWTLCAAVCIHLFGLEARLGSECEGLTFSPEYDLQGLPPGRSVIPGLWRAPWTGGDLSSGQIKPVRMDMEEIGCIECAGFP